MSEHHAQKVPMMSEMEKAVEAIKDAIWERVGVGVSAESALHIIDAIRPHLSALRLPRATGMAGHQHRADRARSAPAAPKHSLIPALSKNAVLSVLREANACNR